MKNSILNKLLFFFLLVVLWQIAALLVRNPVILPYPADIVLSLVKITMNGDLARESAVTLVRGLIGASAAFVFGVLIGLMMGLNNRVREILSPAVTALQSTPVISWILLALIWFDNTFVPVFIIVVTTAPTFIISVSEGILRADPKLLEMAKVFRVARPRIIRSIIIPSILGYLLASVKIVFGLTYRTAVMAEVLAHPGGGIGEKMNWARLNVETADLIAWTLIIVLFAFLVDELLVLASKKKTPDGVLI